MEYKSTSWCSCNEAGEQEVEIEYEQTFFQRIFNKPATKQSFVGSGTVWYYKGSGKRAGSIKEHEICNIVEYHRQVSVYK